MKLAWDYLSSGFTNFSIPFNIQKRLHKYLLWKTIGSYLATELNQDNFDFELVNGSFELRDVDLNLDTLNDKLIDTPFVLTQGRASIIKGKMPWSNWSGEISFKIQGLDLILKPSKEKRTRKQNEKEEDDSPVMSSSLHFADDFLKTEMETDQSQELYESIQQLQEQPSTDIGDAGLQALTLVIEKLAAMLKVDIIDTAIHIVHPSAVSLAGDSSRSAGYNKEYSLDIEIPKISYFDETPGFSGNINNPTTVPTSNMIESSILIPNSGDELIKIVTIASPKIWIRSCGSPIYSQPSKSETTLDASTSSDDANDLTDTEFYEASEGLDSDLFQHEQSFSSMMSGSITPRAFPSVHNESIDKPYEALLFTTMDKENWIRFKARYLSPFNAEATSPPPSTGAAKNIDFYISHIRTMITPNQLGFLLDLLSAATTTPLTDSPPVTSTSTSPSASTGPFSQTRRSSNLENIIYNQRHMSHSDQHSKPTMNQLDPYQDLSRRKNHQTSSSKQQSSSPEIKIKLQVPLMEHFFLYNDESLESSSTWTSSASPPTRNTSHLKVWIRQLIIRLQKFPSHHLNKSTVNNRIKSMSGMRESLLSRSDTDSTQSSETSAKTTYLSSILDTRIQRMGIEEWVVPPTEYMSTGLSVFDSTTTLKPPTSAATSGTKMKYYCYLPILEFNDAICSDYDSNQKFPSYIPQPLTTLNQGQTSDNQQSRPKKDVIRIRLEKRNTSKVNSIYDEATSYEQDLNTDIQALKLNVDVRIADRLENYAYAILKHTKDSRTRSDTSENMGTSEQSFGQKIYEDLDNAAKEYQQGIQAKVRIAFIRTQLSIPDMSQCSTRDEFNDHLHDDTLSVDVHKINAGWMTDLSKHQPQRITVDLDSINVFLKQSQDPLARCWFTAKSQGKQGSLSSVSLSPSMEITIRSSSSETFHPPPSARSGYFGTGSDIPNNLFEHLSRNETLHSEQKMYVPVEDQAESSMMFKQRTVETSMIVLNCHFPITYLTLSNQTWAKIQILQNDLILWQPRIMTYLGKDQNRTDSSTTVSSSSEMFRTASYRRHSDMESSHTSVLSQSHERLGRLSDTQNSSLFSVVAVMGEGVWDLHTNKNQSSSAYRLQFTDFRYFAVIKHLGLNENITTLDIEDLTLDDISDDARKVPLFYRTLPKSLTPRRNTSMVSLFSRLTTIPELNKQNKITSIVVCNICWRFSPNIDFIDNLIDFQKTPDDMVFIDPPTQYIKVYAHVLDTSVDYKPKSIPSRAVVVVDNLQVVTDILAGQPLIDVKTYIQNVDMFLVDDVNDLDETHAQQTTRNWDARRFWSMIGMANVLHSRNLESQVKLKLDDILPIPDIEVTIMNDILTLESCADSFQSLVNFITYATNDGDRIFTSQQQQQYTTTKTPYKSTKKPVKRSHTTLVKTKEDMLSSLDEEAFKHRHVPPSTTPSRHQTPIEDNLMLIEEYYSKAESSSIMTQSSLRPRKPRRKHNRIQKSPEDIIRILSTELQEFDIVENFYSIDNTNKAPRKQKLVDTRRSALSVRVRDVDIIWKLYSGNDWDYIRSSMGSQGGGNTSASTSTSSIATSTTTMGNASTSASRRSGSRPSSSMSSHRYSATYSNLPSSNTIGNETISRNTSTSELRNISNRSPPLSDRSMMSGQSPPYATSFDRSTAYHPVDISSSYEDSRCSPIGSVDSRKSTSQSPQTSNSSSRRRRSQRNNGRATGSADMELRIEGIIFELDMMVPEEQTRLHGHLEIRDVEIVDNIKTSSWDTFFGCMRPESPSSLPRETGSYMVVVDIIGVRPVVQDMTVEYRLGIQTLPLRLFIDQDALNFLVQFFAFNPSILRSTPGSQAAMIPSSSTTNGISHDPGSIPSSSSLPFQHGNQFQYQNDQQQRDDSKENAIFFQHVEIYPIDLKIDYKPKYINYDNIKEGQFAELVNLFQLEGAKLNLSAVKLTGIKGIPKLMERLGQEWLPHIKNTQVPHMVSGVSPIRSMVSLGSGIADLVLLPIQQYRKDGRVIKGIQKGTQSFARTTAMELIKLSARLASGTQVILEHADGFLSSQQQQQQQQQQQHGDRGLDSRDGMVSSSSSPISTVIGSRTSEDMVFVFTDRNLGLDEDV